MLRIAIAYAVTAIAFVGLDALVMSRVALELRREIGGLLLERPNLAIAARFYLLFAAGIVVLPVLSYSSAKPRATGAFATPSFSS